MHQKEARHRSDVRVGAGGHRRLTDLPAAFRVAGGEPYDGQAVEGIGAMGGIGPGRAGQPFVEYGGQGRILRGLQPEAALHQRVLRQRGPRYIRRFRQLPALPGGFRESGLALLGQEREDRSVQFPNLLVALLVHARELQRDRRFAELLLATIPKAGISAHVMVCQ